MKEYPLREPFNDLKYKNMQNSYKKLLMQRYGVDTSFDDDTPVSLQDIYTPLSLGEEEHSEQNFNLQIEDVLINHQFVAITGVAGSGKSTITKFLSVATAENGVNKTVKKIGKRLVLPFILRELDFEKINTFDELFHQWIENLNIALKKENKEPFKKEFFEFYIQQGWAILIFDGFDEIGTEKNKSLIKWLNKFISKHQLNTQKDIRTNIIITGRPTGFLDKVDYSTFIKYYLQPYSQEQIELYAKKYFSIKYAHLPEKIDEKSNAFLARLDKFDDLKQLKSRPIYLMMLAYISENKGELPKTRTLAYQQMVESYLHILDKQKELYEKQHNIELPQWDIYDKTILLEELAYKIHTKADAELEKNETMLWNKDISQLQIQVSKKEILKYLEEIIQDSRFRSITKDESIDEILNYYLARTGLLVEPSEGHIQFSHLSFQEYLTASRIYRRQPKRNVEKYLKEELFNKLDRTGWSEIALLFYGIDALKQGEGQSEQLQFLIDEEKSSHLDFMAKLMILTENQFTDDEKRRWFNSIVYIILSSKNIKEYTNINRYIPQLLKEEKYDNEYEILKGYLQNIYRIYIKGDNAFYDADNLLQVLDEDDKKNDLAFRLQQRVSKVSIVNLLYTMYSYDELRNKIELNELEKLTKNKESSTLLDKYIPMNKNIKIEMANKILDAVSLKSLVELNGTTSLLFAPLETDNALYNEIIKIQLIVNRYLFFINKKLNFNIYKKESIIFLVNEFIFECISINMMDANLVSEIPIKHLNKHISKNMPIYLNAISDGNENIYDSMIRGIHSGLFRDMDKIFFRGIDKDFLRDIDELRDMDIHIYRNRVYRNRNSFNNEIKKKIFKFQLFLLYTNSSLYTEEKGFNTEHSKDEFGELYTQLKQNPVCYFTNKGITLDSRRENDIKELFDESYLLKSMEFILENTDYDEFNEKKAINDTHSDIKELIKLIKNAGMDDNN